MMHEIFPHTIRLCLLSIKITFHLYEMSAKPNLFVILFDFLWGLSLLNLIKLDEKM